jgi:gamma-glutamylputrescine oxidase
MTTEPLELASDTPASHDVVVIGGGILGAGACYWLAKQGVAPLLLEQTAPAYGATGRNGGFLSLGPAVGLREAEARYGVNTAHALLRVTRENQALMQQIVEEEEIDCEYSKPGSIHLALDEQQWNALLQDAEALRTAHIQTTMLDRTHLQDCIDTPLGEEILGGRFCPENGLLHPLKLVQGLLSAAQRYGEKSRLSTTERKRGKQGLPTFLSSVFPAKDKALHQNRRQAGRIARLGECQIRCVGRVVCICSWLLSPHGTPSI